MGKYYDVEQWSEEYCKLKVGKMSSSKFGVIMANSVNKKDEFNDLAAWGLPAKAYASKLALERIKGVTVEDDSFKSGWMEQGNENEPIARSKYECKTFQIVRNGGLFIDGNSATSPDGLVGNGGIECKSVKYNTHFKVLDSQFYDTQYKWQICGQLLIAELEFVDFVSYCPTYPKERELYIYRVERNPTHIDQLTKRLKQFDKLVESYKATIDQN